MAKQHPSLPLHVLFPPLGMPFLSPPATPPHSCLANFPPPFRLQSKMASYGKPPPPNSLLPSPPLPCIHCSTAVGLHQTTCCLRASGTLSCLFYTPNHLHDVGHTVNRGVGRTGRDADLDGQWPLSQAEGCGITSLWVSRLLGQADLLGDLSSSHKVLRCYTHPPSSPAFFLNQIRSPTCNYVRPKLTPMSVSRAAVLHSSAELHSCHRPRDWSPWGCAQHSLHCHRRGPSATALLHSSETGVLGVLGFTSGGRGCRLVAGCLVG